MPSLSWLQNLIFFKFGALRPEKRRDLAFYTRTSCLNGLNVIFFEKRFVFDGQGLMIVQIQF